MPLFDDSRAAWNARKPRNSSTYVGPSQRSEFFAHWDGGTPVGLIGKPHANCLQKVRQDQAFHQNSNGWADIGYNFLVCPHGRVIEGRGADVAGAHCPNHNTTGYGVQLMIGKGEKPTPAMLTGTRRLYDDLNARGKPLRKRGHRDGFATECPGPDIYAWVQAGMPSPSTPPTSEEDDDMTPEQAQTLAQVAAAVSRLEKAEADRYADLRTNAIGGLAKAEAARYADVRTALGTSATDPAAFAALITEALPDDLAKQVANVLADRLANKES